MGEEHWKESLPEEDRDLLLQLEVLVREGKHDDALRMLRKRLAAGINTADTRMAFLKFDLAGELVDLGYARADAESVREGLAIFEEEREICERIIHPVSYEYNLGNAHSSLYAIRRRETGYRLRVDSIDDALRAKSHFWRAYQLADAGSESTRRSLLVNMANLLQDLGRVVESIQLYDEVIAAQPDHPEANVGRADALLALNEVSNTFSAALISQAMSGYGSALNIWSARPEQREFWERKRDILGKRLEELGFDAKKLAEEHAESSRQAEDHSEFRTFCLANKLTLSEHAVYCSCAASRRDDLTIPLSELPIRGSFVPRMMLYLNRLKSEFSLARALRYYATKSDDRLLGDEVEVEFADLLEGEYIGPQSEALRTSFKICFGILDKIAVALCELYELAGSHESLRFESFWRPRGRRRVAAQESRWDRLREIDNTSLVALYSQARDLNPKLGSWSSFKGWRNALEHSIMIVRGKTEDSDDPMRVIRKDSGDLVVPFDEFRERSLLMLRITRAAIFNFVFCVRSEGLSNADGSQPSIVLGPKLPRSQ